MFIQDSRVQKVVSDYYNLPTLPLKFVTDSVGLQAWHSQPSCASLVVFGTFIKQSDFEQNNLIFSLCRSSLGQKHPLKRFWSILHLLFEIEESKGRNLVGGLGGGAEGAWAHLEFGGAKRKTEREIDNLLLLAPLDSKY